MATAACAAKLAWQAGQAIALAISLYQTAITLVGYLARRHNAERDGAQPWGARFALVVCARNEAEVVGRIVRDLLEQEYPAELRDVVVVAHNCTDVTARVAAAAGARVIETETGLPGKAWAIRAAMEALGEGYDFVGVFDADARAEPGLLATVAARGREEQCLQVETVPIADPEWLAEGYGFGRKARNLFWWQPREALGLGTTISGCGWFMRPTLLAETLRSISTLTEDLEMTALLATRGVRVAYVSSARVAVGEPRDLRTSLRQRTRWVRGHLLVVARYWPGLLWRALHGDLRALDLAIYLVAPTRMLTRLGVSAAALQSLLRLGPRLPLAATLPVAAAEWAVPGAIALRERLIGFNRRGLRLALQHGVLSLLWFPIGLWALVTARVVAWAPSARSTAPQGGTHVAPGG
ncbi:glycosyltransferase [Tepidiforma sp.]|uniref:glycosyltransferase n=1 Tax=Tepidiforma sp. TaxID=2682230 RepID=UPI002ADE204A|nr:glycosyltransferase [Tepidiforma sp.]